MKNLIKLEELAMFGFCAYVLYLQHAEWWIFVLVLLGPDMSLLGYLLGNKVGAIVYNLFHHKGVAIGIYLFGLSLNMMNLQLAGIVLFGHSSMDRFFGYRLKLFEGFKFTHLGIIGHKQQ